MNRADLTGLRLFLAIAEHGTLRAAGRELGVNASAVSQQLQAFEQILGTALFVRNTRSVSFTDAGQVLFNRTHHLMAEIGAALEATRRSVSSVSGQMRITLPYRAWQLAIAPQLKSFQKLYPDIELDLSIDEELVDIVTGGFHAGIRLGDYLAEEMIAVPLTPPLDGAYVASKSYLVKHQTPKEPIDLLKHQCIRYRQVSARQIAPWFFDVDGTQTHIDVGGHLVFNDLRSVVDATMKGLGIGWSLREAVAAQISSGELVEVLSKCTPNRPGFYLYYPQQLKSMARLRAFIDHFAFRP